ncbi:hypothetical protein F3X89_17355 [Rhizobium rhizogenes]|uniref:hypothetical protein n=1 Tax=Rhizobium rhizogenes TaxID=359 RepID=UPI00193CC70D|nr:hypothetical protein [Rhizobium rhizogenes]QRM39462.1 hypothetical protein F3X89_17355 [Rhizobium rhizogenes]
MESYKNSADIVDISGNELNPQLATAMMDGKQESFMNADMIISLAKESQTPVTRELWRKYRKALARHKSKLGGRGSEKLRADALLEAMRQMNLPLAQSPHVRFW